MSSKIFCLYCCKERGRPEGCEICGPEAAGKEPERHPNFLSPGILLKDQYLVGRVLGHGGFGVTYLGVDVNLDLRLAIKEHLPKDLATRHKDGQTVVPYSGQASDTFSYSLGKFLEEGRMLVRLGDPEHPNIVTVINFFKAHGTGYLLMRYLDGVSLEQYRINQGGRFPEKQAVQILMAVLDGLRAVHQAGMLHRDVKPENVILTRQGHVKLIDFGAARFAIGECTRTMTQIFTPGFAPFEQYHSDGKQGPWSDIYAAGATMYVMLTGQMPAESLARMTGHVDLRSPRDILGDSVSESVSAAVMKALAMKPEGRFQHVDEFQQSLVPSTPLSLATEGIRPVPYQKRRNDEESKGHELCCSTANARLSRLQQAFRDTRINGKKLAETINAVCNSKIGWRLSVSKQKDDMPALLRHHFALQTQDEIDDKLAEIDEALLLHSVYIGVLQELGSSKQCIERIDRERQRLLRSHEEDRRKEEKRRKERLEFISTSMDRGRAILERMRFVSKKIETLDDPVSLYQEISKIVSEGKAIWSDLVKYQGANKESGLPEGLMAEAAGIADQIHGMGDDALYRVKGRMLNEQKQLEHSDDMVREAVVRLEQLLAVFRSRGADNRQLADDVNCATRGKLGWRFSIESSETDMVKLFKHHFALKTNIDVEEKLIEIDKALLFNSVYSRHLP